MASLNQGFLPSVRYTGQKVEGAFTEPFQQFGRTHLSDFCPAWNYEDGGALSSLSQLRGFSILVQVW